MSGVTYLAPQVGIVAACLMLAVARASYYRSLPGRVAAPRPSPPRTLSAREHRTPYGTDGDYFTKPNRETVFEAAYELMHQSDPKRWPLYYR